MKLKKFENINCNLCGKNDYAIKFMPKQSEFDPDKIFSASGGIRGTQQIVKCNNCGLIYVNPRIKSNIVLNAYSDAVDELYVSQEEGRQKTFAKSVKFVEKYVPDKGKILDVGAAAGFFLNVAKKRGWEPYGVEPSKWMSDWGRKKFKINIKNCVLNKAKFPDNYFDAVTMWDVIEHTPDPMSELYETNRVLKQSGILIINFPNINSKLAKLAGNKWWFLLSVHLYYFTPTTLKKMLEINGFKIIKLRRHYQKLNLEHLIKMVGLYSKGLSHLGLNISKILHINDLQIPYYASQANIVARKIRGNQ